MAIPLPIRERILQKIEANLTAMQEGEDEHVITWNTITRNPWEDIEQQMGDTIGIFDLSETSSDEIGFVRKTMEVATEFWIRPKLGDNDASEINIVMADVNRVMRADTTFIVDPGPPVCQLAVDLVGGVIIWNILYRHDQDDPRKIFGQVP